MLKISNVETFYGKIQALRGVNININKGEIVSLIGSNGAGKSTLLMTISGVNKAKTGEIIFEGKNLDSMSFLPEKKTRCSYSKCDDIGLIGEYAFFTPLCMNDLRMQQLYFCLLKDSSIFVTDREHFDAYYSHSSGLIPVQLIDKKK